MAIIDETGVSPTDALVNRLMESASEQECQHILAARRQRRSRRRAPDDPEQLGRWLNTV